MTAALPANLLAQRRLSGMTQPGVAEGMRALGCWWYPETVSQVEHGTRQLKVKELLALSAVLGCDVEAMLWNGGER
jgi:hypothetical protein